VLAAYDSGNLLSVATALHQRYPAKAIVIAGDDDHRLENNPGREKARAAAEAVDGVAIFPNFSAEQREKGFTDFNDLATEDPEQVSQQVEKAIKEAVRENSAHLADMVATAKHEQSHDGHPVKEAIELGI
jgi:putative DNA primase/helicase